MKFIDDSNVKELKHSIRLHTLIMNGPTQQLCSFLYKLVDFFEDEDQNRRNQEVLGLSFKIVEGLALYVHRSIDERAQKDQDFPSSIQTTSNNILVVIGQCRSFTDKVVAKNAVLKSVSAALKALSTHTKSPYPEIRDAAGNPI